MSPVPAREAELLALQTPEVAPEIKLKQKLRVLRRAARDPARDERPMIAAVLPTPEALIRRYRLTPRQAEVALEVAFGGRNRDVATRMGLSVHTVRRHVERILKKLGISSRGSILSRMLAPAMMALEPGPPPRRR
ncbi:MAG: hypothetical protein HY275_11230 [Gemmatimonadetes bacterium]|nr:hypothetical protein [Gemmatimonadota bacterium]